MAIVSARIDRHLGNVENYVVAVAEAASFGLRIPEAGSFG